MSIVSQIAKPFSEQLTNESSFKFETQELKSYKEETIDNIHKILFTAANDQMEYLRSDRAQEQMLELYDV